MVEHVYRRFCLNDEPAHEHADENEEEDYIHFCNKYLLQILKKFNSNDVIDVYFDNDNPLRVECGDFIGVVAPRILWDGDVVEDI